MDCGKLRQFCDRYFHELRDSAHHSTSVALHFCCHIAFIPIGKPVDSNAHVPVLDIRLGG